MAIPGEVIQEVIDKANISDVISRYVKLKRSGSSTVGLCPFHNEKTPSFHVSQEKQVYHCFGCGAGGTVINFIMQIENLEFVDAIKFLGEMYGVRIPENSSSDNEYLKKKERLYAINKEAGKFFYSQLASPEGAQAKNYLLNRGLSKETIVKFGLGYAPDSWDKLFKHIKSLGFSEYEAQSAGILASSNGRVYDRFRNRVMFPIFDIRGNVIAFGGRVLDDSKPKYLNTNDTPVFDKSSNLFGLNIAKKSKSKTFIMVEGYMDVITLHQHGIDTAVASLGTAFTDGQAKLLKRYAEEVVLCYDGDEAGKKAANKAVDILSAHDIKTKVISLSGAKDPDEFCKKNGVDAFRMVISDAKTPLLYKIGILKTKYDVTIPDQKIEFLKAAAKEIANLPGALDREIYAKEISAEYAVSFESVNTMVKREYAALKNKTEKKMRLDAVNDLKQRAIVTGGESKFNKEAKIKLLNVMFYSQNAYEEVESTFDFELFNDDFYRSIAEKIKEYRSQSNADIKESEFILEFPFEKMGELSEILSSDHKFDDDVLGARQLVAAIKENAKRAEIASSHDLNKARELLAERGKKLKGGS